MPRARPGCRSVNVVYWNDDGRGYLVIGKAPRSVLEAYAGTRRRRRRMRNGLPRCR